MRTPSSVLRHFRHRRAERRLLAALLLVPLAVVGLAFLMVLPGCYDTTVKTPPCSVNAHQEGCPAFPTDMRSPDAGRR